MRSQVFHQVGQSFHWIVVIRRARNEAHLDIQPVRRCHSLRNCIQVHSPLSRCHRSIQHRLGQRAPQSRAAALGPHPQPLQLPGIPRHALRHRPPGNKPRRFPVYIRNQAAPALLDVAPRQPGRLLFKRAEAEPRDSRLCHHKPSVLEQQCPRILHPRSAMPGRELFDQKRLVFRFRRAHGPSLRRDPPALRVNLPPSEAVCINTSRTQGTRCGVGITRRPSAS